MVIFPNRKPAWRNRDPEVRLEAVRGDLEIGPDDLCAIVRDDPEEKVRLAAAERIEDPGLVRSLLDAVDGRVRALLKQRLALMYAERLAADDPPDNWEEMLALIDDDDLLVSVCHSPAPVALRLAASGRINDMEKLAAVAMGPCGREVGGSVVARMDSADTLAILAEKAHNRGVKRLAAERLRQLRPEMEEETRVRDFLARAGALLDPGDWDRAAAGMEELEQEAVFLPQDAAAEFSRIKEEFRSRYEEILRRRREQAEKAAVNSRCLAAWEEICQGIEDLAGQGRDPEEAEPEYVRLVDRWMTMKEDPATPVPPPAALERRFRKARKAWDEARSRAREERSRLAGFMKDLERLERMAARDGASPADVLNRVQALKDRVAKAKLRLVDRSGFDAAADALMKKLSAAAEKDASGPAPQPDREDREKALAEKERICAEIEALAEKTPGRKGAQRVRDLRDRWHALPRFRGREFRGLDVRYHRALEDFHARHQEFVHEQEWRLWANFTIKERLAREAEELDGLDDLALVYDRVRALQKEWKEVGAVPRRESERLWQRFHSACGRNFERCQPWLAEREERRKALVDKHQGFCERARSLAEDGDPASAAAELKRMQAEWKEDGIGVTRKDFRLYKEFRRVCNEFFARRHEDFEKREKEREKNLEAKLALCEEAERLADAPEWNHVRRVTALQKEWKKIGPVPKSHDPEVWERFRAACNRYFAWLDERREENFSKREELCRRALELAEADDPREATAAAKRLQEEWKNTGPAPRDREEEQWQRFRDACDRVFARLHGEEEENERKRLELCYRAEELVSSGGDEKETAAALKELQKEWREAAPAAMARERELYRRFKAVCDAFFSGRRERIEKMREAQAENLRRKEALCIRLEAITGAASEETLAASGPEALARALEQAMQGNALAAAAGGGRDPGEEVREIRRQWKETGPVGRKDEERLNRRFRKALDLFYETGRRKS